MNDLTYEELIVENAKLIDSNCSYTNDIDKLTRKLQQVICGQDSRAQKVTDELAATLSCITGDTPFIDKVVSRAILNVIRGLRV